MHQDYRDQMLSQLRDQQARFSPRAKQLQQAANAEELLGEIEPRREYAYDFLCYRITGYRPEKANRHNIRGIDVRHDLRLFVEDLSEAAEVGIEEASEPVYTVEDLSRMFNVSTKTISRWRDQGLVSRMFTVDGRRRVGFLLSSVDRFVDRNRGKVERGKQFSQLSDDEKGEIIERARAMAETGANLSEVTRQLSEHMKRSPETIRYTLKNFDREHPELAIFPGHNGALNAEEKRLIFQQHHRGSSVPALCKRFGRTRSSIMRILNEMRAGRILELPLEYIYNDDFDNPAMEEEILGEMPESESATRRSRVPAGLPPYLAALYDVALLNREQEYHLFRKMNFFKHKAAQLRQQISSRGASAEVMDKIEQFYDQAVRVKNQIVQANLRLVVSIAKRHMSSSDDFFALVSDGNMSLIRAAEKFDYARGNKFSTYASWAIMKNYARTIPTEFKHRDRFRTTADEMFMAREDDRKNPYLEESAYRQRQRQVLRILNRLDDREQKIISARFGLGKGNEPLTLKEVGAEMGVTKERIRQLEARALVKLREAADKEKIEIDLG
jgi:RNA polymerase primary sigma factor/RNA polymerase sigma factor